MCEFVCQRCLMKKKIRNKITGRIKEYEGYEMICGRFFISFSEKYFPTLIYEVIEDV